MATLTPSELAALLGPTAAPNTGSAPVASAATTIRWTTFADGFARSLTLRLRSLVRAAVRVTAREGTTLTAHAAVTSHQTRSTVNLWQPSGSVEPIAVVLSAALVATFVDRLLGGRSIPNAEPSDLHRPLTDVDHRLAAKLVDATHQSLLEQTANDRSPGLTPLPRETVLADAWLPDCSLLGLSFDLRFVQGGGSLDLLLPLEVAEGFADEPLEATVAATPLRPLPLEPSSRRSTVVAQLASTSLAANDLRSLAVGDILLLDDVTDPALRVFVDGRPRFHAVAGTIDGHKAIRLATPSNAP